MKYLLCLSLALGVTAALVEASPSWYGLPTLTIAFFALVGVWSCFEALVKKLERSL